MKTIITRFLFLSFLAVIAMQVSAQQSLYATFFNDVNTGNGTIVKMNTNGTGFTKVFEFDYTNGASPMGNVVQLPDGLIYGTCFNGGAYSSCCIYSYNPVTGVYADLYDFDIIHGDYPMSGMVYATDGKLYGALAAGGALNMGVIYSFDPVTHTYTDLYELPGGVNSGSCGSPIQASNGKLYGMTTDYLVYSDSTIGHGTLYSYDIGTGVYTDLHHFDSVQEGSAFGSLIQHGGRLYGMTGADINQLHSIGSSSVIVEHSIQPGSIFSYDLQSGTYTSLHNFDSATGSSPFGTMMVASDGLMYGMTSRGGISDMGVIFSYDPTTHTYTVLHEFGSAVGGHPHGDLMQSPDGNLYGLTYSGGALDYGVMFRFNLSTHAYTVLKELDGTDGMMPLGGGFSLVTAAPSAVADLQASRIGIHPQPARSSVIVDLPSDVSADAALSLTDIKGAHLSVPQRRTADSQLVLDMSSLEAGVYLLHVTDGDRQLTRKVLKQ